MILFGLPCVHRLFELLADVEEHEEHKLLCVMRVFFRERVNSGEQRGGRIVDFALQIGNGALQSYSQAVSRLHMQ